MLAAFTNHEALPVPAILAISACNFETFCDGLLLLQMDLPYSKERDCTATSDPEVQHVTTNPLARPGDEEQRVPFRASPGVKRRKIRKRRERRESGGH
ncbi:hypothetical protein NDU88_000497 [Pleurodeles waltl]|uniref:Uncharacterized protein n=1 Tax=Pleurodeles waltl TaxID=8319 RepID=A0AAV7TFZ9_PLEWA|nr:hypothetical protein NDU88_000497 [Pleurodeles waltl]